MPIQTRDRGGKYVKFNIIGNNGEKNRKFTRAVVGGMGDRFLKTTIIYY